MRLRAGSYTVFEPENIERDSAIIGIGHGLAPIDGYRNVEVVDVTEVERLRRALLTICQADCPEAPISRETCARIANEVLRES